MGIALGARTIQRWEAAYLTGNGAELVDELRTAAEVTGTPGVHSIFAMALVEAGRMEEAHAVLRRRNPVPKNWRWLHAQCWALLAAALLGDTELVTRLRAQLLPYRRLAGALFSVVVSGSVAYFTGEAALALDDPDAALTDFAVAAEADEAPGAFPWLAEVRKAITRAQGKARSGRNKL